MAAVRAGSSKWGSWTQAEKGVGGEVGGNRDNWS